MRRAGIISAAAVLLLCGAAQADERTGKPGDGEPVFGVGIVCNTAEQAARYIGLVGAGKETKLALEAVNAQAHNPRACGVATVAFIRDQTMETRTVRNRVVEIVRINVVAGFNGTAWQRVNSVVQYAVIEGEGVSI